MTEVPMKGQVSALVASFTTVVMIDLFLFWTVWTARRWVMRAIADIDSCEEDKLFERRFILNFKPSRILSLWNGLDHDFSKKQNKAKVQTFDLNRIFEW